MSEYDATSTTGASVGVVTKRFVTLGEPPHALRLQCGREFGPFTLAYETYGELAPGGDNAVLVCHALTGDSHAAGLYAADDAKPGWWDIMIGPGKPIDTTKYFVICSNVIGGCMGSSGPASPRPGSDEFWGMDFPVVTIGDMVCAQKLLLDHLGVTRLLSVVGGSVGGMQVLEWSVRFPEMVASAVPLATTTEHSALAIAFNEVARQAIMADPDWQNGAYYGGAFPDYGLAVARMIGHVTYLSDAAMRRKFGRNLQDRCELSYSFAPEVPEFQVESYLRHQGKKFVERFDANSFLYLTKAADYFSLGRGWGEGSLVTAFSRAKCRYLVASFTSDWLYPTYQSKAMVQAMKKNGLEVSFCEVAADLGHDAFLLPSPRLNEFLTGFLASTLARVRGGTGAL
ncbi:Homoserine O-acetyltransferase [Desulfovibrio sp. X2]|uniref:homoserine O-acetyltransferase MetX n=1 Tax=Desulfovibrio sp. X2 TaxID=941449 RepID=UPI000358A89B|nr:homoserine O-acetyltransferase [Desulfovibrio sp. X2]EPR44797.1 Homoserine O-acetyltransferase [Desulfovibrio sp. X2]